MDNLIACLALYQHRQDKAVGINWLSGQTRGLLWYYSYLQQKQIKVMTIYYLNETIQQKSLEISKLAKQGQVATDKGEILARMIDLETEMNIAKEMLDDFEETKIQQ